VNHDDERDPLDDVLRRLADDDPRVRQWAAQFLDTTAVSDPACGTGGLLLSERPEPTT
jgi:hypothetical protein